MSRWISAALGDDRDRVAELAQHLEDRARDAEPALGRLIRVGVAAERDRPAGVALLAQLVAQQRRRLRLVEDAGLEIEARRQAEIGMARPRVAIDAAVLAAAIRVDRAVEADIRRVVARDDRARRVDAEPCGDARRLLGRRCPSRRRTRPASRASKRPLSLLTAPRPLRGLVRTGISMPPIMASSMRTFQEHNRISVVIPTLDAAGELAGDPGGAGRLGRSSARSSSPTAARATIRSRIAPRCRRAGRRCTARPRPAARRRRRRGDGRLAVVPACRLPAGAGLGGGGRGLCRGARMRRLAPAISPSRSTIRAPAARRLERIVAWRCRALALPYGDQGLLIVARAVRRGRRLRRDPADGGCRPGAAPRPRAASQRCRRSSSPRRGAIAGAATSAGRCATCSACRCISLGVPPRHIARLYG